MQATPCLGHSSHTKQPPPEHFSHVPCYTRNYLMNEMILTIHAALHTMTGCLTIPDLIHMISLIAHLLN